MSTRLTTVYGPQFSLSSCLYESIDVLSLLCLSYNPVVNTHLLAGGQNWLCASEIPALCGKTVPTRFMLTFSGIPTYLQSLHPWGARKRNDSVLSSLQKRVSLMGPPSGEHYLTLCPQSGVCSQKNILAGMTHPGTVLSGSATPA